MDSKKLNSRLAIPFTAWLATAMITGCSSEESLGPQDCSGSAGINSSVEQLFAAATQTSLHDPVNHSLSLGSKYAKRLVLPVFPEGLDKVTADRKAIAVYSDVPDGGDAAFVRAVCNRQEGWASYQVDPTDNDTFRTTPHLLRSLGRFVCSAAALSPSGIADQRLREEELMLSVAKRNIADYRTLTVQAINTSNGNVQPDAQAARIESMSDSDLMQYAQAQYDIYEAAVKYQCPALHRVGFGPDCGTFTYPDQTPGQVRINGDGLNCSEAFELLTMHTSRTRKVAMVPVSPSSSVYGYICRTDDLHPNQFAVFYTWCFHPNRPTGELYVIPLNPLR